MILIYKYEGLIKIYSDLSSPLFVGYALSLFFMKIIKKVLGNFIFIGSQLITTRLILILPRFAAITLRKSFQTKFLATFSVKSIITQQLISEFFQLHLNTSRKRL